MSADDHLTTDQIRALDRAHVLHSWSTQSQIDPLVMFWITLANYGLLRHLLCGPNWKLWTLGWFAAGLGTITKGVGALSLLMILPAVVASLMHWPRVRVHAWNWRFLLGPVAFVAAAALWLVPMVTTALSQDNPEYKAYLNDILFRQTAGRYVENFKRFKRDLRRQD